MKIIDTHTHGYFKDYDEDRQQMWTRARKAGVKKQIQIGCDEISSLAALDLAQKNDDFYATLGLHPNDVKRIGQPFEFRTKGFENYQSKIKNISELMDFFANLITKNPAKIVGIGECGFDFYHDEKTEFYHLQREALEAQVFLAKKFNLPLIIHTREANQELIDFFAENAANIERGVIHCFSGTMEMAKIFTEKYGFYLGIGGVLTYNKSESLRQIVAEIPAKFLLTETDAPFLPPHQWRKKNSRNEPASLPEVVEKIAEIKGISTDEMAKILVENAERLFF